MTHLKGLQVTAATVFALVVTLFWPVAPAQAVARTKTVSTAGQGGAGYATHTVTYNFRSRKKVTLRGVVRDKCKANGYGAYGTVTINYFHRDPRRVKVNDVNGCGNGGNDYSRSIGGPNGRRIASISISVQELDCDGVCVVGPAAYSGIIYNPR